MLRIFHLIYKANYRSTKNYKMIDPDGEELAEFSHTETAGIVVDLLNE